MWRDVLMQLRFHRDSQTPSTLGRMFSSPWQGCSLAVLSAWLSAAAGVYTEFLMKRNSDSIFWQNLQLYL